MTILETDRLLLVPYTAAFIEATLLGDEKLSEVSGYTVAKEWPGVEFFFYLPFVLEEIKQEQEKENWTRLVILKKENRIIGEVSAQGEPDKTGIAELGYGIVEPYANQGYATEASKAFLQWLTIDKKIHTVYAKTYLRHKKSQHILKKIGFVKIGEGLIGGDEPIANYKWYPMS